MKRYLAILLLVVVPACGTTPAPETLDERMAAVEFSYQAVLKTAEDMHDAGTLTGGDGEAVADALEGVGVAVRTARAAVDAGDGDALALIRAANQAVAKALQKLQEKDNG